MIQTSLSFHGRTDPSGPSLRLAVLGSGSRGNSVVVECDGRRLLLDAGFSCRELERRLARVGLEPDGLDALVLTHEHGDHCRGAERFARVHDLEVWGSEGTLGAVPLSRPGHRLESGRPAEVGAFEVEAFAIPHDAREPVGLVVTTAGGLRLGLAGDIGSRSQLAWARLQELDVLLLETNHDLTLLREGPYPWRLKQRIAGRHGHLSNREAAEGLPELMNDRLRWVVLYHLSQTNNQPALAAAAIGESLDRYGCGAEVVVASQSDPTPWMEVGAAPVGAVPIDTLL